MSDIKNCHCGLYEVAPDYYGYKDHDGVLHQADACRRSGGLGSKQIAEAMNEIRRICDLADDPQVGCGRPGCTCCALIDGLLEKAMHGGWWKPRAERQGRADV